MGGNPAATSPKKVTAYLLVDVAMEQDEKIDTGTYVPADPPMPGTITIREDNPGLGTHVFIFEDGPYKFVSSGVYIGSGEEQPGGGISFDWGVTRVIQLIAAGAEAEKLSKRMVHEFADQAKSKIEEVCHPQTLRTTHEAITKAIDDLERGFFKVR